MPVRTNRRRREIRRKIQEEWDLPEDQKSQDIPDAYVYDDEENDFPYEPFDSERHE